MSLLKHRVSNKNNHQENTIELESSNENQEAMIPETEDMNIPVINYPKDRNEQFTYLTSKLTEFGSKYLNSQEEIDDLKAKLEKYIHSYEAKAPILAQQKENYESLIITYNNLKFDHENLVPEYEAAIDELQRTKEYLSAILEENGIVKNVNDYLIEQIRQVIVENQKFKLQNNFLTNAKIIDGESLKKDLFAFIKEIAKKENKIDEYSQDEKLLIEEIENLGKELQMYKEKVKQYQETPINVYKTGIEKFSDLERFYAQSEKEIIEMKKKNAELEQTVLATNAAKNSLSATLEKLKAELENIKYEKGISAQQLQFTQENFINAQPEIASLRKALLQKEKEIKTTKELSDNEKEVNNRLRAEVNKIKEELHQMQKIVHEKEKLLFENMSNNTKQVEKLIREKIDLYRELKSTQKEWKETKEALEAENKNLKEENEKCRIEFYQCKTNEEYQSALQFIEEKKGFIEILQQELNEIKQKKIELENENDYLNQQLQAFSEKEARSEENQNTTERYLCLIEDVFSHQREFAETHKDIELLKFQLGQYEEELISERKRCLSLENSYFNEQHKVLEIQKNQEELAKEYDQLYQNCQEILTQKENLQLEAKEMREKEQLLEKSWNEREIELLKRGNTDEEILEDFQRYKEELNKMKVINEGLKKMNEEKEQENGELQRQILDEEEKYVKLQDYCKKLKNQIASKKIEQTPEGMLKLVAILHKASENLRK
ncbi:unnamed protein product [Blepharisma stoltei]|uniref:Uncharacterized protein n=1 Tax=Blepharisma stoltei TaxID=1481888 RepID=A0AAU9IWE5_9CILI|nr:unnamed protein product [Blepharisma stoltei]